MLDRKLSSFRDHDEFWSTFFVQDTEEIAQDMLALVPERKRQYYIDAYNNVDVTRVVQDYPHKVVEMYAEAL
jgi:hypothetical protein